MFHNYFMYKFMKFRNCDVYFRSYNAINITKVVKVTYIPYWLNDQSLNHDKHFSCYLDKYNDRVANNST